VQVEPPLKILKRIVKNDELDVMYGVKTGLPFGLERCGLRRQGRGIRAVACRVFGVHRGQLFCNGAGPDGPHRRIKPGMRVWFMLVLRVTICMAVVVVVPMIMIMRIRVKGHIFAQLQQRNTLCLQQRQPRATARQCVQRLLQPRGQRRSDPNHQISTA
jgi:hypothetical protein